MLLLGHAMQQRVKYFACRYLDYEKDVIDYEKDVSFSGKDSSSHFQEEYSTIKYFACRYLDYEKDVIRGEESHLEGLWLELFHEALLAHREEGHRSGEPPEHEGPNDEGRCRDRLENLLNWS